MEYANHWEVKQRVKVLLNSLCETIEEIRELDIIGYNIGIRQGEEMAYCSILATLSENSALTPEKLLVFGSCTKETMKYSKVYKREPVEANKFNFYGLATCAFITLNEEDELERLEAIKYFDYYRRGILKMYGINPPIGADCIELMNALA